MPRGGVLAPHRHWRLARLWLIVAQDSLITMTPRTPQPAEQATARRREEIRAAAARTLQHSPYHPARRIDVRTGATSLTQALILAAGGAVVAGRAWAGEPTESAARQNLHAVVRGLLLDAGVSVPAGSCPSRVLAGWEWSVADPAAAYRLVGARPAAGRRPVGNRPAAAHRLPATTAPAEHRPRTPRSPAARLSVSAAA